MSKRLLALAAPALLALSCGGSGAPVNSPTTWGPGDTWPGLIVVDFEDGITKAEYDKIEKSWGIDVEFNSIEGKVDGVTISHGALPSDVNALLQKIRSTKGVEVAEPLFKVEAHFVPNDPRWEEQWNMRMINMPDAWEKQTGKGAVVAVIDTGVAYEDYESFKVVPDLKGTGFVKGYDFVNDDEHPNDDHGHGTHVAGTIAQTTNNKEGVAGIAYKAKIMPIKVLSRGGSGTAADVADGIRWAADHGADVINMSLGAHVPSGVIHNACKYAHDKGVVVVASAGNSGREGVGWPGHFDEVIGVSAVGPSGNLAFYSSWGKGVDIAAPGGDKTGGEQNGILQNTIAQRNPADNVYAFYQGTSMAAPHVSGVAALLKASGVKKPADVEKILYESAKKKDGQKDWDPKFGYGILDASAALSKSGGASIGTNGLLGSIFKAIITAFITWLLRLIFRRRKTMLDTAREFITPGFVIAAFISAIGFFFLRWLGWIPGFGEVFEMASMPLADWERAALSLAKPSPIAYSALIPVALGFVCAPIVKWRSFLAGLSVGFAAFLFYAALSGMAVAWLPGILGTAWLIANGLAAVGVAWSLIRLQMGERSA